MSTCERVRELLPAVVAGEDDEHGLGRHLEACAPCRAERARLAGEVERLRAELVALLPSREWEEELREAARGAGAGTARRAEPRALSWAVALPALAAVVVAAFLLPRWLWRSEVPAAALTTPDAGGPSGGDDGRPTRVWSPPSAAEVAATRAQNRPSLGAVGGALAGGGMLAEALWPTGPKEFAALRATVREFPAPEAGPAVHRWVYGDPGAESGPRIWSMGPGPVRGVLVGRAVQISRRLTIDAEPGTDRVRFAHGGRRLDLTAARTLDVTLTSPDGSTGCRVRATYDEAFSGGVWIPDPLARALALQQFEIPGGAAAEHVDAADPSRVHEVVGQPARVRLGIPALGFEEVLGAFVPTPDPVPQAAPGSPSHRLELEGLPPQEVLASASLGSPDLDGDVWSFSGAAFPGLRGPDSTTWQAEGAARVLLRFRAPGGRDEFLVLGALDPGRHAVRTERLRLDGRFPPGARAVLARVWRGGIAIPSAEAVCVAEVAADGTLSFVRCRGEDGGTLRLRLVTKEGRVSWHEVGVDGRLDPDVVLRLDVSQDGKVQVHHVEPASGRLWADQGLWDLGGGGAEARDGLTALLSALAGAGANPALTDEQGASRARLVIEAEPATPWRFVGWALERAQRDDVRLRHAALGRPGDAEPLALDLEAARELEAGSAGSWARVQVEVLPREAASSATEITLRRVAPAGSGAAPIRGESSTGRIVLPRATDPVAERQAFLGRLAESLTAQPWVDARTRVELRAAPDAPTDDVLLVLRALTRAGARALTFRGAR